MKKKNHEKQNEPRVSNKLFRKKLKRDEVIHKMKQTK